MKRKILAVGEKRFLKSIDMMISSLGVTLLPEYDIDRAVRRLRDKDVFFVLIQNDARVVRSGNARRRLVTAARQLKKYCMVVSNQVQAGVVGEAYDLGVSDYIVGPLNNREVILRLSASTQRKKKIVCIGGGTGLFHLLLGLKLLPRTLLTSIVSTSDDGGSSGRLKATFGILPPGDVRRSLVALSNAPEIMNKIIQHRFTKGGGIAGHNFGNLFLTALTDIEGSFSQAVKTMGDILQIQGIVLPITDQDTKLCARFESGKVIKGESNISLGIGRKKDLSIEDLWHEPEVDCNVSAYSAIMNADTVIIGPGDLYTSIITNLLVKGIKEALFRTKAEIIYICNLMTKPGETSHFTAKDHIGEIVKYMGRDRLDYAVISDTRLSGKAKRQYAKKDQVPVEISNMKHIKGLTRARIILADVGHETELVRHDSLKIRDQIRKILFHS